MVTDDDVDAFWRDGVVCLRQVLPLDWLDRMAPAVEAALKSRATTNLSAFADELERSAGATRLVDGIPAIPRGQFFGGTDHWREQRDFLDFALESPLPAVVARLLRSDQLWLYEDSVLVKEPGAQEKTAFHQDMAYFALEGDLVATTWVPLDDVTAETGAVRFVAGSHRDRTRYRANTFVTDLSLGGIGDAVDVPDYDNDAARGDARIISFDTEPGDITVHHARTIHGAGGNASATRRRRAISIRYAGDGTTFAPMSAIAKPHHAAMRPGQPLDPQACPTAWPRT